MHFLSFFTHTSLRTSNVRRELRTFPYAKGQSLDILGMPRAKEIYFFSVHFATSFLHCDDDMLLSLNILFRKNEGKTSFLIPGCPREESAFIFRMMQLEQTLQEMHNFIASSFSRERETWTRKSHREREKRCSC